jgi:aspartate racemase
MKTFGIIGGLGTLSGGDIFLKLLKSKTVLENQQDFHFLFEQRPYQHISNRLDNEADVNSRKFYVYNVCKGFEEKKVNNVLLPCFASHTFIDQLQSEINVSVLSLLDALQEHLLTRYEKHAKIGILTSSYVKNSGLLQRYFQDFELCFPKSQDEVMEAVYGEQGIKRGYLDGLPVELVHQACAELLESGCSVILPGITELSLIAEQLWRRGVPLIDVNQVYADYAISKETNKVVKPFKLGILGGVGPAATVDFMSKVIASTPAKKDQEHIKMIVEQNPQIPDRTAHLLHGAADPTISMYSTCKRLEAEGAEAIAIPCNTAHAFVNSIQPHLGIPIINMLNVTIEYIVQQYGRDIAVGLLATSGTIASRVYHQVAELHNLKLFVPEARFQDLVMESIYGIYGVKAGYTTGKCENDIREAIEHLADKGADVFILGCTELPMMFPGITSLMLSNREKELIDPTMVLANKCVALAY